MLKLKREDFAELEPQEFVTNFHFEIDQDGNISPFLGVTGLRAINYKIKLFKKIRGKQVMRKNNRIDPRLIC